MLEKNPNGENWENIKNANIQPFNITDLTRTEEDKEKFTNTEEEDFVSIDISIAKGKTRQIKVHKNDDPNELAKNFCLVYGLKEEIAERLTKMIQDYMATYLENEDQEENEEIEREDDNDN